jgi:hypothetical protein
VYIYRRGYIDRQNDSSPDGGGSLEEVVVVEKLKEDRGGEEQSFVDQVAKPVSDRARTSRSQ